MLKKVTKRRELDALGRHGLSGSSAKLDAGDQLAVPTVRVSLLGPLVLLAPLALLGEWLIGSTHHRPLGAATFASCTIVLWIAFEAVTRLLFSAQKLRPKQVRRTKLLLSVAGLLGCLFVFARALL